MKIESLLFTSQFLGQAKLVLGNRRHFDREKQFNDEHKRNRRIRGQGEEREPWMESNDNNTAMMIAPLQHVVDVHFVNGSGGSPVTVKLQDEWGASLTSRSCISPDCQTTLQYKGDEPCEGLQVVLQGQDNDQFVTGSLKVMYDSDVVVDTTATYWTSVISICDSTSNTE